MRITEWRKRGSLNRIILGIPVTARKKMTDMMGLGRALKTVALNMVVKIPLRMVNHVLESLMPDSMEPKLAMGRKTRMGRRG